MEQENDEDAGFWERYNYAKGRGEQDRAFNRFREHADVAAKICTVLSGFIALGIVAVIVLVSLALPAPVRGFLELFVGAGSLNDSNGGPLVLAVHSLIRTTQSGGPFCGF